LFPATAENYKFSAHIPYFNQYNPEMERNENWGVYCVFFLSEMSGIALRKAFPGFEIKAILMKTSTFTKTS
jgi:hypothetical protein